MQEFFSPAESDPPKGTEELLESPEGVRSESSRRVILPEGYQLDLGKGKSLPLTAVIHEGGYYANAIFIDDQIKGRDIDRQQSSAYLIMIYGDVPDAGKINLNLQLLDITLRDGQKKKYLYIADRYVPMALRAQGIGRKLLSIAENIATENGCSLIASALMAEDPKDQERLITSKENAGYQTIKNGGGVISIKDLRKDNLS